MRPRLLHLGYEPQFLPIHHRPAASMRPRLLHLGYLIKPILKKRVDLASMRPRLLHLGYLAIANFKGFEYPGFNEAEAFTPRMYRLGELDNE